MSQSKRSRSAATSPPSAKKQRTLLTPPQKQELYEFYLDFCQNQTRLSNLRKNKTKSNDKFSFVNQSYHSRPRQFSSVGLTTWQKVIQAGKADGEWQKAGRPTTLASEEESRLANHIKETALAGHLVTNNAIVIWGLQILAESPRFLSLTAEQQHQPVRKIGGKKWLRAFKKRHGIKLQNKGKSLEIVRAKKTQPENVVDFFRNLLQSHALSHIHSEARRRLGEAGALNFEGVSLGINATTWPQGVGKRSAEELQAEICSVPGLATWQPGVVDVDGDFFFRSC
ncbi:MAG: DNA-binding domain-containing protein [archaeon]|nr:DNA-binding domain-containing protein [archaeon]